MPSDDLPSRKVNPGPGGSGRSHFVVGARGIKIIEELSARGCHLTTIARALRMSKDALQVCRARQPEVEEAYQRGLASEHDALVSNLRTAANEGNVVANLFLLKARHGYREGVPLEINTTVNMGGVLVVPADMTVEEYLARKQAEGMIDVTPLQRNHAPSPVDQNIMPELIERLPEAPIPGSRPTPSGTAIASFPGSRGLRGERGD
ncbi:hypothetical protein FBT96_03830 [Rhodobacter capsulatus]|uniref:Uncharacterized protein n=1 Tax=Rhodobacter capsulatus TaxID=1061 RepID=A0A4U1JZW1_RHOCA|nr:hypothetical protein [Rhodobacter capsulatus]TKD25127.1 hypothetical protein FBT96_03830 [Rhodobacter capsulatus]